MHLKKYLIALLILLLPITVMAAGFNLESESANALGEALSGGAAEAEDASTNYYNPAGFVRLPKPAFSGSGILLLGKGTYTGSSSGSYDIFSTKQTATGSVKSILRGFVTGTYYVQPLVEDWIWIGFGLTVPAGIQEKYPSNGATRYAVTYAKLQTINLDLNMGFRLTREISLGYGLDIIRGDSVAKANILNPFDNTSDWNFAFNIHGYAMGFNLGALYQPCETTRIGVSYRSRIPISMNGNAELNTQGAFTSASGAPLRVNNFQMSFNLPDVAYFNIFQQLTPKIDVMGGVQWERWSAFRNLKLSNFPVPLSSPTAVLFPEGFQDTFTLSVGGRYQLTDNIKLKSGVAYIPSAVQDKKRNLAIPATSAIVASIGARYQFNRCLSMDVALAHPFFHNAPITNYSATNTVNTIFFPVNYTISELGVAKNLGNFLGGQLNYVFD